jgi:enoyl-[acyl-carrier protein] reductase III
MSEGDERVALVTGSGRGIGRSIALKLAAGGADIVVNYFRNREPAEETVQSIRALGRKAIAVKANVGDLEQLDGLFRAADEAFGRLDVFVHNAASGYNRPAMEQRPRGWEWTMNINARSLLFGAQHAVPLMTRVGGGAIVAITSSGSVRVLPDYVVVGASKAALESLVRYLAVELAPLNIAVNAVSPGLVVTDTLRHFSAFRDEGQVLVDRTREKTPARRLCEPEDVAEVVAFLCRPESRMVCGQTVVVDGGYSLLTPA